MVENATYRLFLFAETKVSSFVLCIVNANLKNEKNIISTVYQDYQDLF